MQNDLINTNEYLANCDAKDVISFKNEQWISIAKLKSVIHDAFDSSGVSSITKYIAQQSNFHNTNITKTWFYEGGECEILRAGSPGWQQGKIKINVTLEFIPDQVEEDKSPLDDIRQADINTRAI